MEKNDINSTHELKILLVFFLGYGILYVIPQVITIPLPINFWISELNEEVSIYITLDVLLEIFIIGPIFALLLIKVFNMIYVEDQEHGKNTYSKKQISLVRNIFLFFVGVFILGNAIHEVANSLNVIEEPSAIPLENASIFLSLYWWDEFFGHMCMAFPLSVFLIIYCIGFYDKMPSRKLKWYEWMLVTAIGIGYGIVWVEGWADGQCLLVIAIITLGILVSLLVSMKKSKIRIQDHPFIWVVFIESIVFIIGTIAWGLLFGIKPYYPFFFQPGEL